jgi:hypothetical protein
VPLVLGVALERAALEFWRDLVHGTSATTSELGLTTAGTKLPTARSGPKPSVHDDGVRIGSQPRRKGQSQADKERSAQTSGS